MLICQGYGCETGGDNGVPHSCSLNIAGSRDWISEWTFKALERGDQGTAAVWGAEI